MKIPKTENLEINWSFIDDEYSAVGNIHTEYDISGEYSYHGENSSWGSGSYTEENYWNTWENESASSRTSWEEMDFHHECDEHYEWSLDETDRVYVSDYSYEQTGSMSSSGYRGGSGTYNYESSNYTQGEGWSSLTHSGSYGSSSFHDEYDFTASWSESFDGVTEVYSSAHSATNNVSGDIYNMNGYFSDYYNTYEGQSPDSGGYGDSYPSSDSYASTTSSPGFSFTWDGWNVQSKQGVYIHNSPYSGEYSIPYGLGSWSNPVEQPNSAYSTTPETPAPYTTPSQRYVDDIDDFFYGYDNAPMYETAEQEYGEITVANASGSTSYSNTSDFHEDFSNGEIGNEGVGSNLTSSEKQTISSLITTTYNASHAQTQSRSASSELSWWDLTCAYATGFGSGLVQGGKNIVNGVINTAVEMKNTAVDVGHGAVTAASLLLCDEPVVFEAQSQALQALESNQISSSQYYWRFGETVLSFGTNEQARAAIQWWNGEITDNECSEIIGSTGFLQLAGAKFGKALGKNKSPTKIPETPTESVPSNNIAQPTRASNTANSAACFVASVLVYLSPEDCFSETISNERWYIISGGILLVSCGFFLEVKRKKQGKYTAEEKSVTYSIF